MSAQDFNHGTIAIAHTLHYHDSHKSIAHAMDEIAKHTLLAQATTETP